MDKDNNLRYLFSRYANGIATREEYDQLLNLINEAKVDWQLRELLDELWLEIDESIIPDVALPVLPMITERSRYRKLFRYTVAASLLFGIGTAAYMLIQRIAPKQTAQNAIHDISPGTNKAILKMANGRQLIITGAKNGLLAQQGSTMISKTADGKLVYSNSGQGSNIMRYDTLIVPRGGQHQLKFSDGSTAYLNADSKLRFPENFDKSDRTVELISGEADFVVIHNTRSPFRVKVKGQLTEDIGTEFNINAYPEETVIKTTLLTGSVKISDKGKSSLLKPGQQSAVSSTSNGINIYTVDTDEAFAWKNGKFHFINEKLSEIMMQASRWYNVEVVYDKETLKDKRFGVIGNRFENASELLHNLEFTGEVKFKITNKKITVTQP